MTQLYDRPMSSIPVSVGTSLALESIFEGSQPPLDPERKLPPRVPLSSYDSIWINIETLVRNVAQSVPRTTYFEASVPHVLEIVRGEMDIIQNVFQIEGGGVCKPVFYSCTYKSFQHKHAPEVKFREDTTTYQQHYAYKSQEVIKRLHRETDSIFAFDSELKPTSPQRSLIITHLPVDLLSYRRFQKLELLESHTGILKGRMEWNSKYYPCGGSMAHLPWTQRLLCVFGDNNQIKPQPRKLRELVYEISVKDHWTPLTNEEKMNQAFRTYVLEPYVRMYLLKL